MRFELKSVRLKGNGYEDFFAEIMSRRYPGGDFRRVRPWGNQGDRKHDGYLRSTRTLYQVYAPNELGSAKALTKINSDFQEAIPYWGEHFDVWTFVHNAWEGIPPDVEQRLLNLEREDGSRDMRHFGPPELRAELLHLDDHDLDMLLGPVPIATAPGAFEVEAIASLLKRMGHIEPSASSDIEIVPPDKLDANGFSSGKRHLLNEGLLGVSQVAFTLQNNRSDPELGARVSGALSARYLELKSEDKMPDEIFSALYRFVLGHSESKELEALAVLRYFFDACDIFEAPLEPTLTS